MNGLDLNLAVVALTIIALVAIAYNQNDLAEKAVAGISSLAGEAIKLLRRIWQ